MASRIRGFSKIKNADVLATTSGRRTALSVMEAGLRAIDTRVSIQREVAYDGKTLRIHTWDIPDRDIERVIIIGVGKCAHEAARALEEILGNRISHGALIDVSDYGPLEHISTYQGTHPLPSDVNQKATRQLLHALEGCTERDLVIFIISGGGSTLLLCPPGDESCHHEIAVVDALTRRGATIQELNTVRKHTSLARGGNLARYAYPSRSIALIFSDVPGDDMQFIASGPTVRDTTTVRDAKRILLKYGLGAENGDFPFSLLETPKEEKYFANVRNVIIVSNNIALQAMNDAAHDEGFTPQIQNREMVGEARDVAKHVLEDLHNASSRSILLYGGETTVTVRGGGEGGRNTEFALACLEHIASGELIVALASDGHDNGELAGAICDSATKEKAKTLTLDIASYLDDNNAYPFFKKTGDAIITGDTGSNVSDLILAFKE